MTRSEFKSFLIGFFVVIVLFGLLTYRAMATQQAKVDICHHTASESNPIEAIEVDADAFDGQGQNDHTLHGDFLYNGPKPLNGQGHVDKEVADAWCADQEEPSVTPSPTNEPSPTPTGEPSVTPTGEVTPTPTTEPTATPTATPTPKEEVKASSTHAVDEHGNEVILPPAPLSK